MPEKTETSEERPPAADDKLVAALDEIGKLSCWLWTMFILTSIPGTFNTWVLFSNMFTLQTVPHWCDIPELAGVNWTNSEIRYITSGSTDSACSYRKYDYAHLSKMNYEEAKAVVDANPDPGEEECSSFKYENGHRSAVASWDMVCNQNSMRSVANMMVPLGKLLGSLFFGFIADKWGRKPAFVGSCLIYIAGGIWSVMMLEYWVLVVTLLLMGTAGTACYNVGLTLVMETVNTEHRTMLGILYNMSYPLGYFLLAIIAYFYETWYIQRRILFIPLVTLLLNSWCILSVRSSAQRLVGSSSSTTKGYAVIGKPQKPISVPKLISESPHWLYTAGKRDKAWKVIRRANKKLAETRVVTPAQGEYQSGDTLLEWELKKDTVAIKQPKPLWKKMKDSFSNMQSLLTNSELRQRLLISYLIWFTTALSYYAIGFSHENFGSDPVVYAAVSGVVEALGYLIPIPVLHWTGRRIAIAFGQLLSGALLLSTIPVPLDFQGVILAIAMISRMFNNAVYSIIFIFINELFPTLSRGTAMGTCATISHFAGIVGNFSVMEMSKISRHLTTVICGISAIISGLSVLLLPETQGKELPDSVEEINQRVKEGEHVSIRNCFKFK